jgi:hypothetical protein
MCIGVCTCACKSFDVPLRMCVCVGVCLRMCVCYVVLMAHDAVYSCFLRISENQLLFVCLVIAVLYVVAAVYLFPLLFYVPSNSSCVDRCVYVNVTLFVRRVCTT